MHIRITDFGSSRILDGETARPQSKPDSLSKFGWVHFTFSLQLISTLFYRKSMWNHLISAHVCKYKMDKFINLHIYADLPPA